MHTNLVTEIRNIVHITYYYYYYFSADDDLLDF